MKHQVTLIQAPYLDSIGFRASGYLESESQDDETGPTIEVVWAILEGREELDDDSEKCDWDRPTSVTHCRLGDITDQADVATF